MAQEVDSGALTLADRSYQISSAGAEQITRIDDGNLSQVREMNPIARRSLTPFRNGIFHLFFEVAQAGAGEDDATIDPYDVVNAHNGFPDRVDPNLFDIWLLRAAALTNTGANVTWATLGQRILGTNWGASADQAGAALTPANQALVYAIWDDFTTVALASGIEVGLLALNGQGVWRNRLRLLDAEPLVFTAEVTGAASVNCIATCGIFPIALGQDAE